MGSGLSFLGHATGFNCSSLEPSFQKTVDIKLVDISFCLVLAKPHRYICEIIPMIIVYMSNPLQTLLTTIIN